MAYFIDDLVKLEVRLGEVMFGSIWKMLKNSFPNCIELQ
jgi:hypothetical protein